MASGVKPGSSLIRLPNHFSILKRSNIMRAILVAGLITALAPAAALAQEPAPAPAPAPAKPYSTAETPIGTLLDDPAAKAILVKYIPQVAEGGQIDQARPLTLKALQQYAPDVFTDKLLNDIDTDLARLPKK
jgi:para-nitrobenzyl esterase